MVVSVVQTKKNPSQANMLYLLKWLTIPMPSFLRPSLPLDTGDKVTWAVDDGDGSNSTLFHVDLYDCGDDQSCLGANGSVCGAGEFVVGLCPEEGCYSTVSTASISLPEVRFFSGDVTQGIQSAVGRGMGGAWECVWPPCLPHTVKKKVPAPPCLSVASDNDDDMTTSFMNEATAPVCSLLFYITICAFDTQKCVNYSMQITDSVLIPRHSPRLLDLRCTCERWMMLDLTSRLPSLPTTEAPPRDAAAECSRRQQQQVGETSKQASEGRRRHTAVHREIASKQAV